MKTTKTTSGLLILPMLMAMAFLAACNDDKPNGELDSLIAKRDSIRLAKDSLEAELLLLDERIAALDTTADHKLVTTYQASREEFRHYFEVYGNVETDRAASLYPENPGMVQQIPVSEGQKVRKGDVLMRFDAELVSRNIEEQQTQLALATTLYEKQKRLWDQNIGSEVQYLEAKNRKESLENAIKTLREQGNKSVLRAPFDGIVDKIFLKVGEMGSGQMPAMRIVNNENLYITAEVSERYFGKIEKGDSVWVIVNRTDTLTSAISRIGSFINPNNRTFEVRVDIDYGDGNLLPNSLVVLKINDYKEDKAVAIPSSLIMQDGDGENYVFIIEKDKNSQTVAKKQPVQAGMRYLEQTLIKQGLDEMSVIIDKGSRGVRDGDRVEPTNI